MTMSAAAVISMMMVVVTAITAALITSASATLTAQAIDQRLDLFFGCLAVFHDMSFEVQFLTC